MTTEATSKETLGGIKTALHVLRAEKGRLTQSQVAKDTGIAATTLSALETGKTKGIDFATLAKLCAYFDCEPGDLLKFERPAIAPESEAAA